MRVRTCIIAAIILLASTSLHANQTPSKEQKASKDKSTATSFGSCWSCMHGCTREQDLRLCGKRAWDK